MILDIIALVIISFSLYTGVKKGLIKTLFSTLSFVLALALTITTLDAACDYVKTTEFGKIIYEKTEISIINEGSDEVPGALSVFIDVEELMEGAVSTQDALSEKIGDITIKAACSVLLFAAYSLIIKTLARILDAIATLPVLSTVNKLGGLLAGAVNAWIFMVIITCLITFILPTTAGKAIGMQLDESVIIKWFCNNNPLL